MDLDAYFAENPMGGFQEKLPEGFVSGFVSLVGRPNAGKSTLINTIVGQKVLITSSTAQTTRRRVNAVYNSDEAQIVFVDTPGIHKPHDHLGTELNAAAQETLGDVDVVAMLVDASQDIGKGDEWVAQQVRSSKAKKIGVLSKCDLVDTSKVQKQFEALKGMADWDSIVVLSSFNGHNIDAFLEEVQGLLPEGPLWFPKDMQTDQSEEMLVAEFIREKILRSSYDEVPHSVGVEVDSMEYVRRKQLYRISATIYVERESQKGILIGKGGSAIKETGRLARQDLERLLGDRIFLELSVKVKKNWRNDESYIRRLGYTQ